MPFCLFISTKKKNSICSRKKSWPLIACAFFSLFLSRQILACNAYLKVVNSFLIILSKLTFLLLAFKRSLISNAYTSRDFVSKHLYIRHTGKKLFNSLLLQFLFFFCMSMKLFCFRLCMRIPLELFAFNSHTRHGIRTIKKQIQNALIHSHRIDCQE